MKGSIRLKLILLFIAIGLVPLVVVVSISYLVYADNLLSITVKIAEYNSEWVVENIEKFFRNIDRTSTIIDSKSANSFLRQEYDTPTDAWNLLTLFGLYESSLLDATALQNITIIGLNGKCISSRDGFYRLEPRVIRTLPSIDAILENEADQLLDLSQRIPEYRKNRAVMETVRLGKKLYDETTLEVLGILMLDFYPEEIAKYYRNVKGDIIGRMELVNDSRRSVYVSLPRTYSVSSLRDGLTIYKPILYDGWYLRYRISSEQMQEPLQSVVTLTLFILLVSVLLIIAAFFFISNQIIRPLQILRTHMTKAAGGDFSTRFEVTSDDQVLIGLRNSFNTMVYDLENLMKQKESEHANYLQAHFQMLQQQINPHFLYNTLDTIVWMTYEKRSEEVIELVEALSTFFRLNLSRGAEIVSVADAILCLRSYLSVQKMRYAESLHYEIEVADTVRNDKLLKLVLQPIVENALYHGIREKGAGTIEISATGTEELLTFTVRDDGAGLTPDRLTEIRTMLAASDEYDQDGGGKSHGFGLRNVQRRIQLYYGSEYGLTIESQHGVGTVVTVALPRVR